MSSGKKNDPHCILLRLQPLAAQEILSMKNYCVIFQQLNVYILYMFMFASSAGAQSVTINGRIIDGTTGSAIPHAVVLLHETGEKKSSDQHGDFQFTVSAGGIYTLIIHHGAYADTERAISNSIPFTDTIVISLQPKIFQSDAIIVHSTRTMSDAANTPFPLNVELRESLIRQNSATISDALKNSPGLSVVRDGAWETAISMRGMSRSNIVTLIDHVRIETANDIAGALSLFNVHDLERVETIRSSGAALYGTGALGGVVHIMTKRSSFTDEFQMHGEMAGGISSVNNCASQYLALESSSHDYGLRISGGYREAGNTTTPAGVLPNSQFTDFSFNGSLGVKTFEDQTLHLSYQRSQGENAGISGGSSIAGSAAATYKLMKRELFGVEYTVPDIAPNIRLLSFRASRQNIIRNVEIVLSPAAKQTPHAIHSTTSAQLESHMIPLAHNALVVGTEVWQRELESKRERIKNDTVTGERPIPRSRFLSAGMYAQDEWFIIPERVTLVVGARCDWIYISNEETLNPEYIIANGVLQSAPSNQKVLWETGTAKNDSWSANAGIQYALLSFVDITLLASTAFRSPSLEERYQFLDLGNIVRVGNPDLKPERSRGLNAGFRMHSESVKIQADFFFNRLTNLVTDLPGIFENRAASFKQNIGETRLYGYEISAEHSLTTWSALKYSASYVRGEEMHDHGNLPQIAPLRGSIELTAHLQSAGRVSISSSLSSSQYNLAAGEMRSAGYAVFDIDAATIPFNVEQFTFSARGGIQNIFDKEYRNHLSTVRGIVKSEAGRNFFLSLTVAV